MADDDRYGDAGLSAQKNPGEISGEAIGRLHAMVTEKMADRETFARWFGKYNSTPKYPDMDWRPEKPIEIAALRKTLAGGAVLNRNPASRFSFVRGQENDLTLFVDGQCFECAEETIPLAETLCSQACIKIDHHLGNSDKAVALLAELLNQCSVDFAQED